ncbi:MAG: hypothetical protein AAGU05_09440, partial [Anaerolineaceae bacterium]
VSSFDAVLLSSIGDLTISQGDTESLTVEAEDNILPVLTQQVHGGQLGLGAQPPSPEWGAMLNYGREYLRIAPWMSFFPGFAIFLTMLFVNLIGNGLRDALDPKTRKEKAI